MERNKPLTMDFVHNLEKIVVTNTKCDIETATVVINIILNELYKEVLEPLYDQVNLVYKQVFNVNGDDENETI